jgi:hypothetical protein
MNDARISTGLPAHPKTKKLIRRLGQGAAWHLVCLFLWAASNRSDGDLSGMTSEDIELAIDWSGEPDALVRELASVGFLDGEEGAYRIHDWAEHNPWVNGSDMRSAKARWNAVKRHHGIAEADRQVPEWAAIRAADSNATSTATSNDSDAASNADSNAPSTGAAMLKSNAPSPSPSPSVEATSSLRSDSSSALPDDRPADDEKPKPPAEPPAPQKPTDLQQRVAQITDEAIASFNASRLVKGKGGNLPAVNPKVGRSKRQTQVKRCLRTARAICLEQYGNPKVTPEFWDDYWATVDRDDFHAGRRGGGRGHENWIPDFEFLTREDTMLKLFERAENEDAA